MSSKQLAYVATAGRQIRFDFLSSGACVIGYLVGMDDFHWMVATVDAVDATICTVLLHKGAVDMVTLTGTRVLTDEDPSAKVAIEEIGRPFFDFCERTYFGKATTPKESHS